MLTFDDVIQRYLSLDYDTLLSAAQKALGKFLPECKKFSKNSDGWFVLSSIIFSAICADNSIEESESTFMVDLILKENIDLKEPPEEYENVDLLTITERFVSSASKETGIETLIFCLCAVCVDGAVSEEEREFLIKIFNSINRNS